MVVLFPLIFLSNRQELKFFQNKEHKAVKMFMGPKIGKVSYKWYFYKFFNFLQDMFNILPKIIYTWANKMLIRWRKLN